MRGHVGTGEGRWGHNKDKRACRVVADEVDRPAELTGEDEGNDEIDVAGLACLENPYQLLLQAQVLNLLALLLGILQSMILNLHRQVRSVASFLSGGNDLNVGSNGAGNCGAKQIQDHLPEHKVTGADLARCRFVHMHCQIDITLFEIVFSNALHLFKNVTDLEIRGSLSEGSLADVIDLLEVQNAMEDTFCLVECLLGDALALIVEMTVKLLQVDEGDFGGLLDLAHNLFSEVVEVLFGVHELLKIDH